MKKVVIYRAADAFVYLPTYIAEHRGIFQEVDKKLKVKFYTPGGQKANDQSAIRTMIANSRKGDMIPIALCDPLAIFDRSARFALQPKDLRLIGALITKPCFWGVNKQECKFSECEMGEYFKKVIYYNDKFVTGNFIGRRLQDIAGISDADRVDFGEEIERLLEEHNKGNEAIAVTADIVELAKAHHTKKTITINHLFSENPYYSDFLTTGLITTAEVCDCKENVRILENVVQGIQRAIFVLRSSREMALSVCQEIAAVDKFYRANQKNLTDDEVSWVTNRIHEENFYPTDMAVSELQWINAVKSRIGRGIQEFDEMKEAENMYQTVVCDKFLEGSKRRIASEFGIPEPTSPSEDTIPPEETRPIPSEDTIPPEETAAPFEDISGWKKILPLVIGAGIIVILLASTFLPIELANSLLPLLQISVQSFMLGIVLLCIFVAICYDAPVRGVLKKLKSKKIVIAISVILIPVLFGAAILLEIKQKSSRWVLGLVIFLASIWKDEVSEFVKGKKSKKG